MDFKDRLLQARKEKGLSQETLAEIMGVSRQAVSKWETGEAMPETDKLITLCRALGLDMEYLALGKDCSKPVPQEKARRGWLFAVLAACLAAGFLIGFFLGRMQKDALPLQQYSGLSQDLFISDVTVTPADGKGLEIAILPSILPEGMTVRVLCEDAVLGKSDTITCTLDGMYYRFAIEPDHLPFLYRMTAQLTVNDFTWQLPLIDLSGDASSWSCTHLYERS